MQKAIHCPKTQYNSTLSLLLCGMLAILEIDLLCWYKQTNPSFFQHMFSPPSSNSMHDPSQQPQGHAQNDKSSQNYHPSETKMLTPIVPSHNQLSKKPSFKKEPQQFSHEATRTPIHVPSHLALRKREQAENQGGGKNMFLLVRK